MGWGQAVSSQFCGNDRQNTVEVQEWFVRRESKHSESLSAKECISALVISESIGMLRSIQLDDQTRGETGEVGNVISKWMLTAELHP